MDWTQAFTIIGVLGAFIFWIFTKLDSDIRASHQRIDQLYQMWGEMQKEIKDLYKEKKL